MIQIKGQDLLTLDVIAGNIYEITYDQISALNIFNYTEGSLFISNKEDCDFKFEDNVGNFLTIGSGNGFNNILFYMNGENKIYLKPDANGYISMFRKLW